VRRTDDKPHDRTKKELFPLGTSITMTLPDYDLALDELSVALSYVSAGLATGAAVPAKKEAKKGSPKRDKKKAEKKPAKVSLVGVVANSDKHDGVSILKVS
jgi:hypothetical protein